MNAATSAATERLHALDAVRAGALILGVVFHATLSFLPGPQLWVVRDAQSAELGVLFFTAHMFRMTLFFFIAGFFGRMLLARRGAAGFARDRTKRILIPLLVGWPLLLTAIVACFIWGGIVANGGTAPADAPPPPLTAETFPLTHLWFLYVLLIFYAGALALRGVSQFIDRDGFIGRRVLDPVVRFCVATQFAPVALAAPLFAVLWFKADWLMWFGVPTPDFGLVPNTPALIAFGTAFGFGWLINRQTDLLRVWERNWPANVAGAVVFTIVCLGLVGIEPVITPGAQDWRKLIYAACYTLAIWEWTFGLIGLALKFLSARNPVIRYVADASYWMYLVHLPIVMALQIYVSQFHWPLAAKFVFVLWIAFATMLLSYHLLVRYTFVGAILNGRRAQRCVAAKPPALVAAE